MVAAQPGAGLGRQVFFLVSPDIQRVVGQYARNRIGNRRRQNREQNDNGAHRPQGLGTGKTDQLLHPGLAGAHSL